MNRMRKQLKIQHWPLMALSNNANRLYELFLAVTACRTWTFVKCQPLSLTPGPVNVFKVGLHILGRNALLVLCLEMSAAI